MLALNRIILTNVFYQRQNESIRLDYKPTTLSTTTINMPSYMQNLFVVKKRILTTMCGRATEETIP